eukprot:CAMPEP_0197724386 /NCGR_PEP_ID=MMETSP1434-20131217/6330_1 /TAXON_ID=265543 /ORGANISM="Minutocellus polymorphus, Strain CCMP3303" /LENGTH=205 /DNA_ID=CAMNT_0043309743 /DNA_START=9 /DNA_END=626 /DNA_ORIENTATION=-
MLSSAANSASRAVGRRTGGLIRTAFIGCADAAPPAVAAPALASRYQPDATTSQSTARRNMTVLSKQSAEEYKKLNFSERAKKTGRPVSPHVAIYAFPIGALTSIVNRVTGCALSVGAAGLGAAELLGGSGTALDLMSTLGAQGGVVAAGAKFGVAFPVVYHYLGGLRHLAWDRMPDLLLTNADVDKASYALAGSSVLISLGLVLV